MLQVNNITKRFNGVRALDNCSFDVDKGKITALMSDYETIKKTVDEVRDDLNILATDNENNPTDLAHHH